MKTRSEIMSEYYTCLAQLGMGKRPRVPRINFTLGHDIEGREVTFEDALKNPGIIRKLDRITFYGKTFLRLNRHRERYQGRTLH